MTKALLIGISGQDGAHLANFLLKKNYQVYGTSRNLKSNSFFNLKRLGIFSDINLYELNPESFDNTMSVVKEILPDEIYHLSSQSAVGMSFDVPVETINSIVLSASSLLQVCKKINKDIKIYNAVSGEMFGNCISKADENTRFRPCSPYAVAKVASHNLTKLYRETYNMFACNGIMFNHDSYLRPDKFVTQKIIKAVKKIANGENINLALGNLSIQRDWGWSPEYVEIMWLMLQNDAPKDYIIATGKSYSLNDFVQHTFEYFSLNWQDHVVSDKNLYRPNEILYSKANPSLIKKDLNWEAKLKMPEVIKGMIEEKNILSSSDNIYHLNPPLKEVTFSTDKSIKLIKSHFLNKEETLSNLLDFISGAEKLSMGSECKKFENGFSAFQERRYSVMVSNGSSANLGLLQALLNLKRLKIGDKVAFSAVTWSTNVMPIIQLGLVPVPVDVNLNTLNVGSNNFKNTLEENPDIKAFFITNILGFCSDIDKILEICDENNIILFEDNCESLGSEYKSKKLGNYGLASTCSFFVGHHLSTIEGGIVTTDDEELYRMLQIIRAHGWNRDLPIELKNSLTKSNNIEPFYDIYTFYELAYNIRPTEISGFIGNTQLPLLESSIKKRAHNYKIFRCLSYL